MISAASGKYASIASALATTTLLMVGCANEPARANATSNATSSSTSTTTSNMASPSTRPFYLLASIEHSPSDLDPIVARINNNPERTNHPGKRPWSRGEVLDRLDAMAALENQGIVAMGTYARARVSEPIENSDPRSAYGGGSGPDLSPFNEMAMMMLGSAVHTRAAAAKDNAAAILALYKDIATTPLPMFSNSGGATDGKSERDDLVRVLSRNAPGGFAASAKERAAISYKSNRP